MRRTARGPATVHFEIGRVTLHGFSAPEGQRFVRSLEASLNQLGTSRATAWPIAGRRTIARLDAGALRGGATPEEAASVLATALRVEIGAHRAGGEQP